MGRRLSLRIMKQGGTVANENGKKFEIFVENLLINNGYEFITSEKYWDFAKSSESPIFSKQVNVGESIYGTQRRCDFIFFHPEKFNNHYIIECKWQSSPGSVDEKYPFTVLNIQKSGIDTIIILDGDGYKKGAKKWLKAAANGHLQSVLSMSEFHEKCNKGFL